MICNNCNKELIWGGDHSYEDYALEGEGIVSNYTCANPLCNGETIIIYTKIEDEIRDE